MPDCDTTDESRSTTPTPAVQSPRPRRLGENILTYSLLRTWHHHDHRGNHPIYCKTYAGARQMTARDARGAGELIEDTALETNCTRFPVSQRYLPTLVLTRATLKGLGVAQNPASVKPTRDRRIHYTDDSSHAWVKASTNQCPGSESLAREGTVLRSVTKLDI